MQDAKNRQKVAICAPLYNFVGLYLRKADLQSLDFTFNRLCMKRFKIGSIDVVKDCLSCFAIDLPSCVCKKRQDKFILRYNSRVVYGLSLIAELLELFALTDDSARHCPVLF